MKKRNVFFLGLLSCMTLLLAGCSSDEIWDVSPLVFHITVVNAQGEDLLNPETPGNITTDGIKAVYLGETYEYGVNASKIAATRYYMPRLYGLMPFITNNGTTEMTFGELDGAKDYSKEEITIVWNDKTQDIITFSHTCKWKKGKPQLSTSVALNGTDAPAGVIRIVK